MNLNQVTVPCTDLESSIRFYETLGLKLIVKSSPRYARFECPDGDSTFSIELASKPITASGIHVYFECTDLDERVKDLLTKGVSFSQLPADQDWLWREARLNDPDGNELVLFYAGKNRRDPPWRIS